MNRCKAPPTAFFEAINAMSTQTIQQALKETQNILRTISDAPIQEAAHLLSFLLKKPHSYLYAWPNKMLSPEESFQLHQLLTARKQGEPLAYLLGTQPFWNFELTVTPDTLIPRPETELLVSLILEKFDVHTAITLADLGTGSGAIACALAKERPHWQIFATDISMPALKIAKENAHRLGCQHIHFRQGDWCEAIHDITCDVIVSNPPYISPTDPHLLELTKEPALALIAENNGIAAIEKIICTAKNHLHINGHLYVEHGYQQKAVTQKLLQQYLFSHIQSYRDAAQHWRVTTAQT